MQVTLLPLPRSTQAGRAEFSGVGAEWSSLGQKLSRMGVVQGILLLNLHPELLNNFTYSA